MGVVSAAPTLPLERNEAVAKVQMIAGISGARDGVDWPPVGGVLECPQEEADHLIANGFAKPVVKAPKVETADAPVGKVETAAKGLSKASTGL